MSKDLTAIKETVIKELFSLGAHFGFSRARSHPSVRDHIYTYKNKTAVIDLEKTIAGLERAQTFAKKVGSEGKQILLVGSKNEARPIMEKYATANSLPYVTERWIGGTFTNFKQIRSRVEKMKDYFAKEKAGELAIYTKRERSQLAIEAAKLKRFFSGIENMERLPGAILVVDSGQEKIAVTEARKMKIPVISLSGSDCDINLVDYPIVANDMARASIEHFVGEVMEAFRTGKLSAQAEAQAKAEAIAATDLPVSPAPAV